jgi:hypothetical protein
MRPRIVKRATVAFHLRAERQAIREELLALGNEATQANG